MSIRLPVRQALNCLRGINLNRHEIEALQTQVKLGSRGPKPRPEREFLAELREAAATEPVDAWLLYSVDQRVAELDGREL